MSDLVTVNQGYARMRRQGIDVPITVQEFERQAFSGHVDFALPFFKCPTRGEFVIEYDRLTSIVLERNLKRKADQFRRQPHLMGQHSFDLNVEGAR